MPQSQKGTPTDRLADIIQVVQLGRKSGLLTIERGEGHAFEEGAITFNNGQITQAKVGERTGQAALNWLKSWASCRFTFTPFTPIEGGVFTQPPYPSRNGHENDSPPLIHRQNTHPLPSVGPQSREGGSTYGAGGRGSLTIPQRLRSPDEALQIIDRSGLSRAHRRLFLLIDGSRPMTELARLVGRETDEVVVLLYDLERAGLIRQ